MPPTRAAPLSTGPDETPVDRVPLQVTRDADRPSKIASREALAKRRAQSVTCIREHTAEAHPGRGHPIDLGERDLRLGTCRSIFHRKTRSLEPHPVVRPALGKKKTQRHHHWDLITGEC